MQLDDVLCKLDFAMHTQQRQLWLAELPLGSSLCEHASMFECNKAHKNADIMSKRSGLFHVMGMTTKNSTASDCSS